MYLKNKTFRTVLALIAVLFIIIVALLLRSCTGGNGGNVSGNSSVGDPIGDFSVTDEQQSQVSSAPEKSDVPSITFAGYGKYSVSSQNPNLELRNPDVNFVDMVFTVTDAASGEIIARTGKVAAGEYVYVNMMNFYSEKGTYNVEIAISTYDSQTGTQMNGMNQKMELTVD